MIVGGCDESDPGDALDAQTQEKNDIAERSKQEEDPVPPAAQNKTTKEVVRERFGEGDPTTFIVEEPADIELGLELLNKKPSSNDQ
jgi:hypothetical protein